MKLAIVTSHPIQYYAPWFKYMSKLINIHVFYMHDESENERHKGDFGASHEWDIDLLDGYTYSFLKNISKIPSVNNFNGCDTPEIYKIIKNGNFDAVLVTGWYLKSFWQAVLACKIYNIPVLVRGDSTLSNDKSFFKRIIKRLVYPIILNIFDIILTVGKNNKKYLQYYGVSEKKIVFTPHFIDQKFFMKDFLKYKNKDLKNALGISTSANVLLFVGKFIELKRPLDILKAMLILNHNNVEVEAVFVGSGKLKKEMKEYCQDNPKLKAHFVGFKNQSELSEYYNLADLLILPSSSETWGLVVNETFAVLTPAIVSDQVGCSPDLIDVGLTGEIFECGNIKDLAIKIKIFLLTMNLENIEIHIKRKNEIYSMEYATENLIKALSYLKDHSR